MLVIKAPNRWLAISWTAIALRRTKALQASIHFPAHYECASTFLQRLEPKPRNLTALLPAGTMIANVNGAQTIHIAVAVGNGEM